ncbi:hypothetical protein [Burkholderia ubonensis]|uniref:hypothetical protein n=1 Tax=Burkholderia ubonensis TaxID=101571 RepID=UPI0007567723|nr:hypothetical protein [Burkholderia ubonensis]KWC67192.1 hypothetical protein WL54_03470 [Burkholderia ubonensis]
MEGLQKLDFGRQPSGEGGDTYRKAAIKIQANFDAISAAMDTKADAGGGAGSLADERDSRIRGDAETLASANAHAAAGDAEVARAQTSYADGVGAARLADAKAYADLQDATKASAANARMDRGDASVTAAANARMDNGDASTLSAANEHAELVASNARDAAKAHADSGDEAVAATANARMDNGDANTLASAKAYADGVGGARLTDARAYADAQDAKVTADAHTYADDKASTAQTNATSAANAYTDSKIAELVDGAPDALNTLNEIAKALNDDANYAADVTAQLAKKANTIDVDAKDAAILAQAKQYTDNSPASGTPQSYVDAGDANTLANANAYTDSLAKGDIHPSSVTASGKITGVGAQAALKASNGGGTDQTSILLTKEGGPVDQKTWEILNGTGGDFQLRTISDGYANAHAVLIANRGTGTALANVQIAPQSGRVTVGATGDDGSNQLQVNGSMRASNYGINKQTTADSGYVGINIGANGPNIAFYGATTGGAGMLTFSAGGSERMRLTSAGNLMVGTSAPAAGPGTLTVGNSINVYSGSTDTVAAISTSAYADGLSIEAFNGANTAKKNIALNAYGGRVLVGSGSVDDGRTTFQVSGDTRTSGTNFCGVLSIQSTKDGGTGFATQYFTNQSYDAPRWSFYKENTAETGGNIGSNLAINYFDDDGKTQHQAMFFRRSTGTVSAANRLTVGTTYDDGKNALQVNGNAIVGGAFASRNAELGSMTAVDTPYVDFHTTGTGKDFDARIIAEGGTVAGTCDADMSYLAGSHRFRAGGSIQLQVHSSGRTFVGDVADDGNSKLQVQGDARVYGVLKVSGEAVTVEGANQVGVVMSNTAANRKYKSYVGPGGVYNIGPIGADGNVSSAYFSVDAPSNQVRIGNGVPTDTRSTVNIGGGAATSISNRVYLYQGDPNKGGAGEIAFKRVSDGTMFYMRGWGGTNNAGIEFVNAEYSAVVGNLDNGGNMWLAGNLSFKNGGTVQGDGNVLMKWRNQWLSDGAAHWDDAWNKANDAQVNRADRGAQCHHNSGLVEWGFIGADAAGNISGQMDYGDPWVIVGLRTAMSYGILNAIWPRAVWLRNN